MDAMSPQLFALFTGLVEEACGLHYSARDREVFAAKVEGHVSELGYDSLLDYYYRLRYDDPDGEALRGLIEALLVHETYFFRELAPLLQLADDLATLVASHGRARVWSAACSTGEEPYTMAMLLAERGVLDRVEIIATDLSTAAIARARAGRHGRRSLRDGHPAALAQKYLDVSGTSYVVAPMIRQAVQFEVANLFAPDACAHLGQFDVVLCRNVLIYFRDEQVAHVIEQLRKRTTKHGLIAVGVSESLLRFGTTLVCEERGSSFFYRSAT